MQDNNIFDEIIIGAGPAGLTAAYELLQSGKENVLILEKNDKVGGLASTKVFGEYSYDIGPHRFFTKNEEINELFLKMLGKDAVKVNRLTILSGVPENFSLNFSSCVQTPTGQVFE